MTPATVDCRWLKGINMDPAKLADTSAAASPADESDHSPDPGGDYAKGRYVTCYSSEEFLAALESIRR